MNRTVLWITAVVAAAILGWTAAMVAQSPAPLRDEEDAYVRFGNAMRRDDAIERTELLIALMREVGPETLPGAARAFREHLYLLEPADIRLLMAYWAQRDPRQMVVETSSWGDSRVERLAASRAVYQIARTEGYPAARAFYDSLEPPQRKGSLVNLAIAQIKHGDMKDLAGFITSFSDMDERETVASVALHEMIRKHGPAVVQTWIEGLDSGRGSSNDLKRMAFRAAQSAHLDNDLRQEFIDWLERVGDLGWAKGGWRSVAVNWARIDPLAAIEWAGSLRDVDEREEVVAEAIRVWAVRNPDEAGAWILAQPPRIELDRGTGRLAVHHALERPSMSLRMLERIVSRQTFANAHRRVEYNWNMLPKQRKDELLARLKEVTREWNAARNDRARGAGDDSTAEAPSETTADPS